MATELDVLGIVSERLTAQGLAYMLTGSFALAYYATPRMTRDLDLVVAIAEHDVDGLVRAFNADFYVDGDAARAAIRSGTLFKLMHLESGIKVDLVLSKLVWARDTGSEVQRRDIVQLLAGRMDLDYIRSWAHRIGVATLLETLLP
jgi:hypothetical protein